MGTKENELRRVYYSAILSNPNMDRVIEYASEGEWRMATKHWSMKEKTISIMNIFKAEQERDEELAANLVIRREPILEMVKQRSISKKWLAEL